MIPPGKALQRAVRRHIPAALAALLVVLLAGTGAWAGQSPTDIEAGRDVFAANCAMCHGADASGMMGMHPSLRGAVPRLTAEGVEVTIRNGRNTQPPMPAFGGRLTDQEINQVIAYLEALPAGPRNFGPGFDGGMMDGMMDRMPGSATWGTLAAILFVVAVVVAATVVAVSVWTRRATTPVTAREILDRRYAQGELDRDEYLQRRADLDP